MAMEDGPELVSPWFSIEMHSVAEDLCAYPWRHNWTHPNPSARVDGHPVSLGGKPRRLLLSSSASRPSRLPASGPQLKR